MAEERKTSVFVYGPIDEKISALIRRHSLKLVQNAALLMFAEASPALREAYLDRVDEVASTGSLPDLNPKARAELFRQEIVHLLNMARATRGAGPGTRGRGGEKTG